MIVARRAAAVAAAALLPAAPLGAQALPQPLVQLQRVDANPGFDRLAQYNAHVRAATAHSAAAAREGNLSMLLFVGGAALGAYAYQSFQKSAKATEESESIDTDLSSDDYVGAAAAGVSVVMLARSFGGIGARRTELRRAEAELQRARALFPQLDPRR